MHGVFDDIGSSEAVEHICPTHSAIVQEGSVAGAEKEGRSWRILADTQRTELSVFFAKTGCNTDSSINFFKSNTRNPNPLPTGFRFGFLVYGGA